MHLANQSSGKPDTLSQGSSKLDKLSQSSMGDTLDKRGSLRPQGQTPENPKNPEKPDNKPVNPVNPEKQRRGEC